MKQREIKFRAWDKVNHKWLSWHEEDPIQQDYDGLVNNGYWSMFLDYEPTEVSIMQFTGLTDKNGVDIYEGDILEYGGIKNTIIFKYGMFCYNSGNDIYPSYVTLFNYHFKWDKKNSGMNIEVIGNIHQNPELLK